MDQSPGQLLALLQDLVTGKADMIAVITNPMRQLICHQLGYFMKAMPADFDLRGASIGNLILAGGYLNNHQHLDPIIFLFSKLVNVQGTVRAIANKDLHLAAHLENGECVIGQHLLTGKETSPIESPIREVFLNSSATEYQPATAQLRKKNRKLIQEAELICYPPGSFYSSLMANLLPAGVGTAVVANDCPKLLIPNLGTDPEQLGLGFDQMVKTLVNRLQSDVTEDKDPTQFLNFVLADSRHGKCPWDVTEKALNKLGIQLVDTPLISDASAPYYDDDLLVSALLSFA
jgi:CofD-related protein of GAK system